MRSLSRGSGITYNILEVEDHEENLFLVKGLSGDNSGQVRRVSCLGSINGELEQLDTDYIGGAEDEESWSTSETKLSTHDSRLYNFYGSIMSVDTDPVQDLDTRNELEQNAYRAMQNDNIMHKMDELYQEYREDQDSIRAIKL